LRHNFQTNTKPSLELKSRVSATRSCKFWESALQKHAGHKTTCGEIRLVGGGSEATVMQEPNISDVVKT